MQISFQTEQGQFCTLQHSLDPSDLNAALLQHNATEFNVSWEHKQTVFTSGYCISPHPEQAASCTVSAVRWMSLGTLPDAFSVTSTCAIEEVLQLRSLPERFNAQSLARAVTARTQCAFSQRENIDMTRIESNACTMELWIMDLVQAAECKTGWTDLYSEVSPACVARYCI